MSRIIEDIAIFVERDQRRLNGRHSVAARDESDKRESTEIIDIHDSISYGEFKDAVGKLERSIKGKPITSARWVFLQNAIGGCARMHIEYFLSTKLLIMKANNDQHIILDKELRRDIDAIIQRLKSNSVPHPLPSESDDIKPGRSSRERSHAVTKLQEAVMWLGMDLKAINDENPGAVENPYPHSKDPSSTKIDPTADGLKL